MLVSLVPLGYQFAMAAVIVIFACLEFLMANIFVAVFGFFISYMHRLGGEDPLHFEFWKQVIELVGMCAPFAVALAAGLFLLAAPALVFLCLIRRRYALLSGLSLLCGVLTFFACDLVATHPFEREDRNEGGTALEVNLYPYIRFSGWLFISYAALASLYVAAGPSSREEME